MDRILEQQGRCIGGQSNIKVTLYGKRYHGQYQIKVVSGVHTFSKVLMTLNLTNFTLNQAKEKYYDVLTPLRELWEMDENANND